MTGDGTIGVLRVRSVPLGCIATGGRKSENVNNEEGLPTDGWPAQHGVLAHEMGYLKG